MVDVSKFSLGATAAIITSMGLVAGLDQGEGAKTGVVTGLLVIAIADNISDSLGFHIYRESQGASLREIRSSTFWYFLVRLLVALSFVAIVVLASSRVAFAVCTIWGLALLSILSWLIAKRRKARPLLEVALHLVVALLVIAGCKLLGTVILGATGILRP